MTLDHLKGPRVLDWNAVALSSSILKHLAGLGSQTRHRRLRTTRDVVHTGAWVDVGVNEDSLRSATHGWCRLSTSLLSFPGNVGEYIRGVRFVVTTYTGIFENTHTSIICAGRGNLSKISDSEYITTHSKKHAVSWLTRPMFDVSQIPPNFGSIADSWQDQDTSNFATILSPVTMMNLHSFLCLPRNLAIASTTPSPSPSPSSAP